MLDGQCLQRDIHTFERYRLRCSQLSRCREFDPLRVFFHTTGLYPVHVAADQFQSEDCLRYLTNRCSDHPLGLNLVSKQGYTALHHAALGHSPETVAWLLDSDAEQTRISPPAAGFSATTAADPIDRTGWFPLHCAAAVDDFNDLDDAEESTYFAQTVEHLLDPRNDSLTLEAETASGLTAAWIAARYNCNAENLTILLEKGANFAFAHPEHGSLLHAGAAGGHDFRQAGE